MGPTPARCGNSKMGGIEMTDAMEAALIAAASALAGGIAGGVLSGAYQHARDHRNRPKLQVDFEGGAGNRRDAKHKGANNEVEYIYIRARVRNLGRRAARNCRVFLTGVHEVQQGGQLTNTTYCDSLPVPWAGNDLQPRDIPEGPHFYVDLVRFSKEQAWWYFGANLFSSDDDLKKFKGTLRLSLMVTADNASPHACAVDVTYKGDWKELRAVSA